MNYVFKCINDNCSEKEQEKEIDIPISEISNLETKCLKCKENLVRVYSSFGLRTSDGYKS